MAQRNNGCAGWPSGFFLDLEPDHMPLGLLQNHVRDVKEREGTAADLDLPREGFHALVIRREADRELRQRQRRFAPVRTVAAITAALAPLKVAPRSATTSTATGSRWSTFAARAAGLIPAGRPAIARGPVRRHHGAAAAGAGRGGRRSRGRGPGGVVAGVFGVTVDGWRFLGPGGQEKLFQIKISFWSCAHAFKTGHVSV